MFILTLIKHEHLSYVLEMIYMPRDNNNQSLLSAMISVIATLVLMFNILLYFDIAIIHHIRKLCFHAVVFVAEYKLKFGALQSNLVCDVPFVWL